MADMEPPAPSKSRARVLSDVELGHLCKLVFAPESTFHRIIALCVTTGQRRGELARLERSWLDGDVLSLPSHVTKNGLAHAFPVGPIAKRILETTPKTSTTYFFPAARDRMKDKTATVFNGWGKPKAALDKKCGVTGWQIHDLRRTVATGLAELDVPPHVIERLLNHVAGSRNPEQEGTMTAVGRVYNRARYLRQMREAVEKWEAHLASLL